MLEHLAQSLKFALAPKRDQRTIAHHQLGETKKAIHVLQKRERKLEIFLGRRKNNDLDMIDEFFELDLDM